MKIVLADVDAKSLTEVQSQLAQSGTGSITVPTDVSDFTAVTALADAAFQKFGQVDLLFNNAGVLVGGTSWERSVDEWKWVLDVNVMGVIHGIKAFVPRMIAADREGVVINTASIGGLIAGPYLGPYTTSKFAVAATTETLHYELSIAKSKIRAALLCPGEVATGIFNSDRIRPAGAGKGSPSTKPEENAMLTMVSQGVAKGMSPLDMAGFAFDAIARGKFWIFPHQSFKERFTKRYQSIMS